jgi:hypothetical protein
MTLAQMTATFRNLLKADGRILAILAGSALSGCAASPFKSAAVDPTSPVAAEVSALTRADAPYPTFASIPQTPAETRPVAAYGQAARALEQAAADLEARTTDSAWTLNGTEAFAAKARQDAGPEFQPTGAPDTDAFLDEALRRATPPPPPRR